MIPPDHTTASTLLPSRRIAARSYPIPGRHGRPENFDLRRPRASSGSETRPRRRSVSSMKGLMPLALSSSGSRSTSTSSSPSLAEEGIINKIDGYFPEILAKDLQLSSAAFLSRNMTSGPPDINLDKDEDSRAATVATASTWAPWRSYSPSYMTSPGPGRSLVPIQERNSVMDFHDSQDHKYEDSSTDQGSISGTDISRGPTATSINYREQSVITAATSLTSSCWGPSPKNSPPFERPREHSWIEPDSEEEDTEQNEDVEDDGLGQDNIAQLSPRPPTPPDSSSEDDSMAEGSAQTPPAIGYNRNLHRKSYSVSGGTPNSLLRRHHSGRRESASHGRAPSHDGLHRRASTKSRSHAPSASIHRPRASTLQTPRSHLHQVAAPRTSSSNYVHRPSSSAQAVDMGGMDLLSDEEETPVRHCRSSTKSPNFMRPISPPSPLPSVQSWLNGAARPYAAQCAGDDLARTVPLPPNVVETLRVSIACFPETMLLTSSLTVETIRNYSKKVRQPSADLVDNLVPDSPGDSARKSLWKRGKSLWKSGALYAERRIPQSNVPKCPSTTSLEAQQTWLPLKNVFGCCSDYICDALWAHIVAYNYISALVPRTPAQPRGGRTRNSTSQDSQKEEIPKKAASLLGLSVSTDVTAVAKKLTSQLSWGLKDGMVADQSPRSTTYDNATRDIQAGLMRCIMRLIATAKLMSEDGRVDDRAVEMETREVDVLFTRSLCEIVRMAEETS